MSAREPQSPSADELRPLPRFAAAMATWTFLFLACPGILARDGSVVIAAFALAPWAAFCSRPGKRAFWVEWLAAAIGCSALTIWSTYVLWITLLAVAIVPALYMTVAGVVLRRVARRLPLALAVPVAWIGLEALRSIVEPPFGFGWLRLGHHASGSAWLVGSARVWGTGGVGWCLAAFAGGIADLYRARRSGLWPMKPAIVAALALGPFLLGIVFSFATSAPATEPGPRVMLVQPAFEQERKMNGPSGSELLYESIQLTKKGIAEARAAGEPEIDLVAWGETMFPWALGAPDLLAEYDRGARTVPWARDRLERPKIEEFADIEREAIGGLLLGRDSKGSARQRGALSPGTSFLTGVLHYAPEGKDIRLQNAIVLWNAQGERTGLAGKVHLVPGAEQLCGLEHFAFVRDLAFELSGYVPDLLAFERTQVLPLAARNGRTYHFGATVCFDNAYEDPYLEPLRRGPVDFHLVVSNEAWYRESFEYDQMLAFTRLLAIESGRAIVRATNAGITCVIAPDGSEIARLREGQRDRMVAGTLRATVPVPTSNEAGGAAPTPIYGALRTAWLVLWIGGALALAIFVRPRAVTARVD
jgi:apolipoprotein N-acyltransferase